MASHASTQSTRLRVTRPWEGGEGRQTCALSSLVWCCAEWSSGDRTHVQCKALAKRMCNILAQHVQLCCVMWSLIWGKLASSTVDRRPGLSIARDNQLHWCVHLKTSVRAMLHAGSAARVRASFPRKNAFNIVTCSDDSCWMWCCSSMGTSKSSIKSPGAYFFFCPREEVGGGGGGGA